MKKKTFLLIITIVLAFQLIGCGSKDQSTPDTNPGSDQTDSSADLVTLPVLPDETIAEQISNENENEEGEKIEFDPAYISCVLPKGFVEDKEDPGTYVYRTFPRDISTISYVISDSGDDIRDLTLEGYAGMIEKDFYDAYGDEVKINISDFDTVTVDERPGLRIKMFYTFKGVDYEQLAYILNNGDEFHYMNFTQEKGAGHMEEFEACAETFHFVAAE